MRRTYLFAALFGVLAATVAVVYWAAPTTAKPALAAKDDGDGARKNLPLAQVVLFNSGVGLLPSARAASRATPRIDPDLPRQRRQ